MKNILIYGESWRGTMGFSVKKGFESLGYCVDIVDPESPGRTSRIPSKLRQYAARRRFQDIAMRLNGELRACVEAKRYEMIVVIKGLHVQPETVSFLRRHCPRVVNWNHDEFFNPLRNSTHVWSPYIEEAFKLYDAIATPRRHLVEPYRAKGARRVLYIPFACDPEIHHPRTPTKSEWAELRSDVVFVGNWSPLRSVTFAPLLGEVDLAIWGASWWRAGLRYRFSRSCSLRGLIPQERMPLLLACSRIALNVYTRENSDRYTIRNFEIAAAGAFQLAERTEEAREFFAEDHEAAYFSSAEELLDKCRFYLGNPSARDRIAKAGYERFQKSGYTYGDRVRALVEALA